ncbi:hypothetical protein [Vibrio sp. ES.051]|uniref:hypothetical protein n=1 Tax=Vibrio sp. ES.051 TaxID=1761909 RepID=UPI00211D3F86|nr:hypothetical protein [Vibrio sp. ES.051]
MTIGGSYSAHSQWKVELSSQGSTAKAYDKDERLTGFIVTKENINQTFTLLREVQSTARG